MTEYVVNYKNIEYTEKNIEWVENNIVSNRYNECNSCIDMISERIIRIEMWLIYVSIIVLYILFLSSTIMGINSTWYQNLRKTDVNPYVIGILWAIATLISYGAIISLWDHIAENDDIIDLSFSALFLVGAFIVLLWSAVFFQGNNLGYSVWASGFIFVYHFWLFCYIWMYNIGASLLMIPILMIYAYLFYSMVHLVSLNDIII